MPDDIVKLEVSDHIALVTLNRPPVNALNAAGWACYRFDDGSVRLVCSWQTDEAAVDELIEAMAGL